MNIEVLFFASARDLAGVAQLTVELPDGADVNALLQQLTQDRPALQPVVTSARFARNEDFVDLSARLQDGDQVAWLPPVSGG
jgi:molybdopterin converting factor subunit 1